MDDQKSLLHQNENKQPAAEKVPAAEQQSQESPQPRPGRVRERLQKVMPLLRTRTTTAECMFLMILALLPAAGTGIYHYGVRAMLLIGLGVASAVLTELLCDLIFRKGLTIFDYSAVVTGLIVGLIMPPTAPYRFPVIASAVAIFAFKMLFGGLGKNIFNPAGTGKFLLLLFFPSWMANYAIGSYGPNTPLQEMQNGTQIRIVDMLTGNVSGCIGTTSVIAILIGAAILAFTGVIDLQISLPALISFAAFYFLFGRHGLSPYFLGAQLCGGSLLFTFFFMANDYTTSPVGKRARILDGVLLGVVTGIFRVFLGQEENGALYALLIMNVVARILERRLIPKPFGAARVHRTVRVHVPVPGAQSEEVKTSDQLANERMEEDFRQFEQSVLPRNAASGSETAGTIDQEAINRFENRRQVVDGNGQPYTGQPYPGEFYNGQAYNGQNGQAYDNGYGYGYGYGQAYTGPADGTAMGQQPGTGAYADGYGNTQPGQGYPEGHGQNGNLNYPGGYDQNGNAYYPGGYGQNGNPYGPEGYGQNGNPYYPEGYGQNGNPYYPEGYGQNGNPYYPEDYGQNGNPYYPEGYGQGGNPYYPEGYGQNGNPYDPEGYGQNGNPYYPQGYGQGENPYYPQDSDQNGNPYYPQGYAQEESAYNPEGRGQAGSMDQAQKNLSADKLPEGDGSETGAKRS